VKTFFYQFLQQRSGQQSIGHISGQLQEKLDKAAHLAKIGFSPSSQILQTEDGSSEG